MSSVQVIIEDLSNHPKCEHGPTLLFIRYVKGEMRNFFACSACRDRKDCPFFQWEDKQRVDSTVSRTMSVDHEKLNVNLEKILQLPHNERYYCHECSELFSKKQNKSHLEHDVTPNITNFMMQHPSELIKPLNNTRKEAQYLFSQSSVTLIVEILRSNKLKNILCMGSPRIHEYIRSNCQDMNSILLDFDKRYHSFYTKSEYCWYNMFNNYFFLDSGKEAFDEFMKTYSEHGIALVTDPPFGGRVEPLAYTIKLIDESYKSFNNNKDLPVLWIFPYFMETHILNSLPNYTMLDYKVDYENHASFQDGPKARKNGSPVRIFTNIPQSDIALPAEEGYKHCGSCSRWVYAENVHCTKCNACTSKDGKTYVHCDVCNRCVKPSWKHCDTCQRCALQSHKCQDITFTQQCFHCKELGHKKRDCPKANNDPKRKNKTSKHSKRFKAAK